LCDLLEPEDVKDLKEKVDKAGSGEPVKAVLQETAVGLGAKGEGKFTEFA
jgi:DnaJ family protein C protein 2